MNAVFDKIAGSALQSRTFIKTLAHHRLFPQNILFKSVVLHLQFVHCRLAALRRGHSFSTNIPYSP